MTLLSFEMEKLEKRSLNTKFVNLLAGNFKCIWVISWYEDLLQKIIYLYSQFTLTEREQFTLTERKVKLFLTMIWVFLDTKIQNKVKPRTLKFYQIHSLFADISKETLNMPLILNWYFTAFETSTSGIFRTNIDMIPRKNVLLTDLPLQSY